MCNSRGQVPHCWQALAGVWAQTEVARTVGVWPSLVKKVEHGSARS